MKNNKGVENKPEGLRSFGIFLSSAPSLIFRLGCWFLNFKRKAKKGGRVFQKELIKQGIDKPTAEVLTEIYLKPSELRQYMTFLR
jgi:hypothetical protein